MQKAYGHLFSQFFDPCIPDSWHWQERCPCLAHRKQNDLFISDFGNRIKHTIQIYSSAFWSVVRSSTPNVSPWSPSYDPSEGYSHTWSDSPKECHQRLRGSHPSSALPHAWPQRSSSPAGRLSRWSITILHLIIKDLAGGDISLPFPCGMIHQLLRKFAFPAARAYLEPEKFDSSFSSSPHFFVPWRAFTVIFYHSWD